MNEVYGNYRAKTFRFEMLPFHSLERAEVGTLAHVVKQHDMRPRLHKQHAD